MAALLRARAPFCRLLLAPAGPRVQFCAASGIPSAATFSRLMSSSVGIRSTIVARLASQTSAQQFSALALRRCGRRFNSSSGAGTSGAREEANRRIAGYWLMGTAGMVFIMVVLGGVTRLTRSGLSIVEWRPHGEAFPTTDAEWAVEFEKYKAFPEYKKVNSRMELEEFKFIYLMEWFHRAWGRAIGIAFAGPLAYLALSRRIPAGFGPRLGVLLGLGAAQGGVGWWMVKSGLEHERFADDYSIPRVSPYRLATHLGFAFTLYSLLLWNGMSLLAKPFAAAELTPAAVAAVRRLKPVAYGTAGIVALTAASGAFVAGNDAGHAYNDWPLMAGQFVPEQIWDDKLGPANVFENTATVQFDHRMLAYTTLAAVGACHMVAKKAGGMKIMPQPVRRGLMAVGGLVALQIALGISTLMLYVPVSLGAAHQGGALALLTGALGLAHAVRRVDVEAVRAGIAAASAGASAGVKQAGTAAAAAAGACVLATVAKEDGAAGDV